MLYAIIFVSFIAIAQCQIQEVVSPDTHFTEIKDLDDLTQAVHNKFFSDEEEDFSKDIFGLDDSSNSGENVTTTTQFNSNTDKYNEFASEEYEEPLINQNETPATTPPEEESQRFDAIDVIYSTHSSTDKSVIPYQITTKTANALDNHWSKTFVNKIFDVRKTYDINDLVTRTETHQDIHPVLNLTKEIPIEITTSNIEDLGFHWNNDFAVNESELPVVPAQNDIHTKLDLKLGNEIKKMSINDISLPNDQQVTEQADINFDEIHALRSNADEVKRQELVEEMKVESVTDVLIDVPDEIKKMEPTQGANIESIANIFRTSVNEKVKNDIELDSATVKNIIVTKFLKIDDNSGDPKFSIVENPSDLSNVQGRQVIFAKPILKNENDTLILKGQQIGDLLSPGSNEEYNTKDFSKSTYIGVPMRMLLRMLHSNSNATSGLGSMMHGSHDLNSGVLGFIKDSARNIGDLVYRHT